MSKSSAMVEEPSPPQCDPRCMSSQPSQCRYQLWFGLLVVLVMLVACTTRFWYFKRAGWL